MRNFIIVCENGSFAMTAESISEADRLAPTERDKLALTELGAVIEIKEMGNG